MSNKSGCAMAVTAVMGVISFAFSIVLGVVILVCAAIWFFSWLGQTPRNKDGSPKRSRMTIDGE